MDFDFAQNAVVPSLDKVPEQFRALYVEDPAQKGTFKLMSDDGAVKGAVEAIVGLNKALKAARLEAQGLKGKAVDLSALSEYGKSVDEISAGVKTKLEELQGQVAAGKGAKLDLEKIKQELAAGHAKETEAKVNQVKSLQAQLETILVDNALRTALGDQAIDPDLVMPVAKKYLRAIQDEGKFKAVVVDEDGSQRFSGATGQPMTINELVADLKRNTKYTPLFKSEAGRGSGSNPGGASSRINTSGNQSKSSLDKIKQGLDEHGFGRK